MRYAILIYDREDLVCALTRREDDALVAAHTLVQQRVAAEDRLGVGTVWVSVRSTSVNAIAPDAVSRATKPVGPVDTGVVPSGSNCEPFNSKIVLPSSFAITGRSLVPIIEIVTGSADTPVADGLGRGAQCEERTRTSAARSGTHARCRRFI